LTNLSRPREENEELNPEKLSDQELPLKVKDALKLF
jgi:hypothetical protein